MAAKRPDFPPLLRVDVAAEDHQSLDRFRHERRRLVSVREGVWPRPQRLGAAPALWVDLGLDDAGVSVVDRTQDRDRPPVSSRMTYEELSRSRLTGRPGGPCGLAHDPGTAFWTACATVSLSAKPSILTASVPGRM